MFDRLKTLLGFETRSSLANPSPEMFALFGAFPTAAGVSVSAETALRSPTTLATCRVISESVGSLPIHLFRRGDDGARDRDTTHPAAVIMAGDWCPWAGGVETRTAMQLDALLHGAAYAQVIRTGNTPRELHRLDPTTVTRDTSRSEPRFKVRENGQDRFLDWRDVLYIPTPGSAGNRLVCLVNLCREAIAVDMAMAEHQARLFSSGARPSGVFKYSKTLGPEVLKRLRESFNASHAGGANSGRTLILEDGMEFEALQFSSVDLQFLELRRFAMQEIARAFKVPGTLIGDLDRATWRNVEELSRQYLQFTLLPWLEAWQAGLTRVLLAPEERKNLFLEFTVDDLLRADLANRFAAYRNAVGGAWLTPNEVRALDNRPSIEGGDELIRQAGQSEAAAAPAESEPLRAVA
jgi:HK97 family phage portal protein